jgi:hypothetical protein
MTQRHIVLPREQVPFSRCGAFVRGNAEQLVARGVSRLRHCTARLPVAGRYQEQEGGNAIVGPGRARI